MMPRSALYTRCQPYNYGTKLVYVTSHKNDTIIAGQTTLFQVKKKDSVNVGVCMRVYRAEMVF
jgi:hypothetical protein